MCGATSARTWHANCESNEMALVSRRGLRIATLLHPWTRPRERCTTSVVWPTRHAVPLWRVGVATTRVLFAFWGKTSTLFDHGDWFFYAPYCLPSLSHFRQQRSAVARAPPPFSGRFSCEGPRRGGAIMFHITCIRLVAEYMVHECLKSSLAFRKPAVGVACVRALGEPV